MADKGGIKKTVVAGRPPPYCLSHGVNLHGWGVGRQGHERGWSPRAAQKFTHFAPVTSG